MVYDVFVPLLQPYRSRCHSKTPPRRFRLALNPACSGSPVDSVCAVSLTLCHGYIHMRVSQICHFSGDGFSAQENTCTVNGTARACAVASTPACLPSGAIAQPAAAAPLSIPLYWARPEGRLVFNISVAVAVGVSEGRGPSKPSLSRPGLCSLPLLTPPAHA